MRRLLPSTEGFLRVTIISTLSLVLLLPAVSLSQDQVGAIAIEGDSSSKSPYESAQEEAITYFEQFLNAMPEVRAGRVPPVQLLSRGALQYLASVNLFCTLRFGSCPTLLQAMYEIEAAQSIANGQASCQNLNLMWKSWLDADMERRVDLDLKIGFVKAYDEFKSGPRRKYVRCSASIQTLMEKVEDKRTFFSKRYDESNQAVRDIRGTVKFLRGIQTEIPNLLARLGLGG